MTESFRNLKLSHIEPIYLIRVCLRDLWMVILASLCCAMLAGTALILFFPNRVQADVTLVVTNRVANASVIQTSKSATQAAETFSSLINTDLVRTRIAKEAGYPDYDGRFKVSVRSEKMDFLAADAEGKATGCISMNAKAVSVKSMDVDKEQLTDTQLAAGSSMTLVSEELKAPSEVASWMREFSSWRRWE